MITSLTEIESVMRYLRRIGGEPTGLFAARVKENVGQYWKELARIKFHRDGRVFCVNPIYMPTDDERAAIAAEFATTIFPTCVYVSNPQLPPIVTNADPKNVFTFRDTNNNVLMMQVREDRPEGKVYLPVSFWNDNQARICEPDLDLLPLWGLDSIKNNTTAIISEGAKTGQAIERIIRPITQEDHERAEIFPWTENFAYAASVAFCGGALASERTDWSALKRHGITRAIIVADNDYYGRDAINKISERLDMPTFAMTMTDDFPVGWDCADEVPDHLYRTIGTKKYYIGAGFNDLIQPATWMTNLITVEDDKGKPKKIPVLRQHVIQSWAYSEEQNVFISLDFPSIQLSPESIDRMMIPFSHTRAISELLLREYSCRIAKLAYRPDTKKRRIMSDGQLALNLYEPSPIVARSGDISPFLEFMEHMIPVPSEREEVIKWCATLVSKPEVRLIYGLLMISEQTGIGKTLLAEKILAPLVGMHNASFPSENMILEPYTNWICQKRLVVIAELYQGASWRMANKLKSFITDTKVPLREMYKNATFLDNFAAFYASSNSEEPLKLDEKERRWFIPTLSEVRWPDDKFDEFLSWLDSGGLNIIKNYFDTYPEYIRHGTKAPKSMKKTDIIESGRDPAICRCYDLAYRAREEEMEVAIGDKDLHHWLRAVIVEKCYTSLLEERKAMVTKGFIELKTLFKDGRMFFNNQSQTIMLSEKCASKAKMMLDDAARRDYIRKCLRTPSQIMMEERM